MGQRRPYSVQGSLGLIECLEQWSRDQWTEVIEREKQHKAVSDFFKVRSLSARAEEVELEQDGRLLDGPVLIRRIVPHDLPRRPVAVSDTITEAQPPQRAFKGIRRFGKPIPEPVKLRQSTSNHSADSSISSILGMNSEESRQAKRARLDKLLPPSLTESQDSSRSPPSPWTSQQSLPKKSSSGTFGANMSQKRGNFGAFRKSISRG